MIGTYAANDIDTEGIFKKSKIYLNRSFYITLFDKHSKCLTSNVSIYIKHTNLHHYVLAL